MNKSEPANYQSYLLRLRRDRRQNTWKVWLQSTATERVFQFEDALEFWDFLQIQMGMEVDLRDHPSAEE
jgi:hypothetical protein